MPSNDNLIPNDKREKILSDFGLNKWNQTTRLNRFKIVHPDEVFEYAVGYVFMTKPDLNIFNSYYDVNEEFKTRYEFMDIAQNALDFKLLHELQISMPVENGFINMITNYAENFDLSDDVIKTEETSTAFTGWNMVYGGTSVDSRKPDTFSISYTDSKGIGLYKLHSVWVEYINLVKKGLIHPKKEYVQTRIVDYASALFYILVAEDGERIIYAAEYNGVFPTNVPNSAFNWSTGNFIIPKFSITYQYNFKEDMRLSVICGDFNVISKLGKQGDSEPIRNPNTGRAGAYWLSNAKIVKEGSEFKLKFIK
jgi:hypothetical protein